MTKLKSRGKAAAMIIGMRTCTTKPGCRERFLKVFREKTVAAHVEIGRKLLGPFLSVEHPDTFFFMRGFRTWRRARR